MGLFSKSASEKRKEDMRYIPGRRTKQETISFSDKRDGKDRGFVALDFEWPECGTGVTLGMYIDPDRYEDIPYILNKAESILLNYKNVTLK